MAKSAMPRAVEAARPERPVSPLRLLSDEPVKDYRADQLSLEPLARVVAGAALGMNGPFAVGVFGGWGEGKTSVLQQARRLIEELESADTVIPVWFNAWRYEKEDHPLVPLIASIVAELDRCRHSSRLRARLRNKLTDLSAALRAVAYGFSARGSVAVPGVGEVETRFVAKEMVDRYEEITQRSDPLLEGSLYYRAFERLATVLDSYAGKERVKIIVFIDDLDRCLPPQILKLLESLKLVLSQKGFVFVLAVNRPVVESYLQKRYREEFGLAEYELSGTSYLDKIIQLSLALPSHRAKFKDFINRVLDSDLFEAEPNNTIRRELRELVEVLAYGSNFNPRSVIRFINNLIVDRHIWSLGGADRFEESDFGLAAVSRILREHLRVQLYSHLVQSDGLCQELATIVRQKTPLESLISRTRHGSQGMSSGVLMRLRSAPFLIELLATRSGLHWLEDGQTRRQVSSFLAVERPEVDAASLDDNQILQKAVRESLVKKPFEPLESEDYRRVVTLSLNFEPVGDELLAKLQVFSRLRSLYLSGSQVTDRGLELLGTLARLESLYINSNLITGRGLTALRLCKSLRRLCVNNSRAADFSLPEEGLPDRLEALELNGNRLDGDDLRVIGELEGLRRLSLVGCGLDPRDLEPLARIETLEELDLRENGLDKEHAALLESSFEDCQVQV